MTDEPMVERVARALFAIRMEVAEDAKIHEPYTWETENAGYRAHCLREARAAIEAMRPAPNDMLEAMHTAMFADPFDGTNLPMLGAGFDAAIDAALTEPVPATPPQSA